MMSQSPLKFENEGELMVQFQNGNSLAFQEYYERKWQVLVNIAYAITGEEDGTAKLVQNTMLVLWEHRDKLCLPTLFPNLLCAMKYEAIRYFKEKNNNIVKDDAIGILAQTILEPSLINFDTDLKEFLKGLIKTETHLSSDIFISRFFKDLKASQIAVCLELPLINVQDNMLKIYLRFAKYLEDLTFKTN